jgi:hypothetical protein
LTVTDVDNFNSKYNAPLRRDYGHNSLTARRQNSDTKPTVRYDVFTSQKLFTEENQLAQWGMTIGH